MVLRLVSLPGRRAALWCALQYQLPTAALSRRLQSSATAAGASASQPLTEDSDALARRMAETISIQEANSVWEDVQKSRQTPTIDVVNAFLGKKVRVSLYGKRAQRDAQQHFTFVKQLEGQGVKPNLATLTILAQLTQDPSYTDEADKRDHEAFLVDRANALCCSVIASMKTSVERREQGPMLLATCNDWLRKYTSAKCLSLTTYAVAMEAFGRHLKPATVLRSLKVCKVEHPPNKMAHPLYLRIYVAAAHTLFARRKYKRLLQLFFEMHNLRVAPLPRPLAYCALHLCSVLQPPKTEALFQWMATTMEPDAEMCRYVLDSYANQTAAVDKAVAFFDEMTKRSVRPNVAVHLALMRVYKRRSAPEDAKRLLDVYAAMRRDCADRPSDHAPYQLALWAVDRLNSGAQEKKPETVKASTKKEAGKAKEKSKEKEKGNEKQKKALSATGDKSKAAISEGQRLSPEAAARRRQVLADAKADGHHLFWFLHS